MFPDESDNELNEPCASYAKKRITFFSSFEEMENDQLQYYASLSPEELLKNHKTLSMAAFGLRQDPGAENLQRIIKFKKEE